MKAQNLLGLIIATLTLLSFWPNNSFDIEQTRSVSSESGQITAHKFEDVNENGVQDEGERDVEGWLFRLYNLDEGQKLVAERRTDSDGNVIFRDLPAGCYRLWEEKLECWTPITPPDMNQWNGGYYIIRDLGQDQRITIDFGNAFTCILPPDSFIDVEKYISLDAESWYDADTTTEALEVSIGKEVYFKFWIKNIGDGGLSNIILRDDAYDVSGCTLVDPLAPGTSFECVVGPVPVEAGWHTNTATAMGDYEGERHRDTDDVNYFGISPSISVEKHVSVDGQAWADADTAPGPDVFAGEHIWFRFVVTNDGTMELTDVTLTDDEYGFSYRMSGVLAPGESFTYNLGPLTAEAGQHTNTATATGEYDGETYNDADDAHYFGVAPSINVKKYVSVDGQTWEDADAAPGPEVFVGEDIWFRFVVTNDGTVALTDLTLVDSAYDFSYQMAGPLARGGSFTYNLGALAAELGQHTNTATASGDYGDETYSDTDNANYAGVVPEPTTLALEPDVVSRELPEQTSQVFTATVWNQQGGSMEDVVVSFSTDLGQFEEDEQYLEVETNAFGEATVTVSSTVTGTAHIRAWVDDGDEVYTEGEVSDEPSIIHFKNEIPDAPTAEADLEISMSYRTNFLNAITYFVVARNLGPDDAHKAVISDTFPARLTGITWSCAGDGGASCLSNGSGNTLYETLPSFPNGGVVTYTIRGRFDDWGFCTNVVSVNPPGDVFDPDMSNNTARADRHTLLLPLIFKHATFY